ncbi:MAG: carbohydrate ABC transporter permease [Mycoplasmatales bacterium]
MNKLSKILIYSILILTTIIVLFPFIWMLLTSFKSLEETQKIPPVIIPSQILFSNYQEALTKAPFLMYFINSIIITIISTILVLIVNSLGAFAFTKYSFKGKEFMITILLATMMVPSEMLIITNFQTISMMQLADTRVAIFLPYISSVFYLILMKQFFEQIPKELYLAAKVDGDSDWQYFRRILLPTAKPILTTVAVLNVIGSWNSFLWPLLITNTETKRTLPIGLSYFTTEAGSQTQLLMAASTIVIIPLIVFFIITRKFVISGLMNGSVKG